MNDLYLEIFGQTFVNREDLYYRQKSDGSGSYTLIKESVTALLIDQHLKGEVTLCLPAISTDDDCKWSCFDDDGNDASKLDKIEDLLNQLSCAPLREGARMTRKGIFKAGHLWLLFDKPLPSNIAYSFPRKICSYLGLANNEVEIFPKQYSLSENSPVGNGVRLPLGFHRKSDAMWQRSYFEVAGVRYELENQLEWLATSQILTSADLITELEQVLPMHTNNSSIERSQLSKLLLPPDWPIGKSGDQKIIARCPGCVSNGNDKKAGANTYHLFINRTTGYFSCRRGCTTEEILIAAEQLTEKNRALDTA